MLDYQSYIKLSNSIQKHFIHCTHYTEYIGVYIIKRKHKYGT